MSALSPSAIPASASTHAAAAEAQLEALTMRRVGRRLLPFLFLLYVVCYIDRTNVSFAALQMNRDLGFSAAAYGLGAGIFFLGYALFEVPSNLILMRVGARRWIGRIAITWGILASAMMFIRNTETFYLMRFLVGVAEAGYFPGIIYYLSQWFPERHRARATARFAIGIPLASVLGGPLSGWLLGLDGRLGLAGWQWLFLLEGIPAVLLGVVAIRWLTDKTEDAQWLTAAERDWLSRRLSAEASAHRGGATLRQAFTSATFWWLCAPYFVFGICSYALTLWLPIMVKDAIPVSNLGAGLVVGLVGVATAIGMLVSGSLSDRRKERVRHAAAPLVLAAAGFAGAGVLEQPALAVGGLAVAFVGVHSFMPPFWCLPSALLRGTAAAGGIALINALGNLGGFVGPNLLGIVKSVTGSFSGGLLALTGVALLGSLLTLSLTRAVHQSSRQTPPQG